MSRRFPPFVLLITSKLFGMYDILISNDYAIIYFAIHRYRPLSRRHTQSLIVGFADINLIVVLDVTRECVQSC